MAGVAAPGAQRRPVRRLLARRPELGAAAVVALAWIGLAGLDAGAAPHAAADPSTGATAWTPWICRLFVESSAAPNGWSQLSRGLPNWELMTVAMMGPAALAGIRHTGLNTLTWRRGRAMVEFGMAYLAVWTTFGAAMLVATALGPQVSGSVAVAAILCGAAAWQMTPAKRRSLRECHRALPLPPRGWRAELGALRFGLRNGLSCLGSCWCFMLVMTVLPDEHLLWALGLALVAASERLLQRPRRVSRLAALALGLAAVTSLWV